MNFQVYFCIMIQRLIFIQCLLLILKTNDYTTENVVQIFESNNLNDLISTFRKFRQNCIQIENEWFNSHDNSKLINIDIPCGLIEFTQEDFEYILEKYEF